MGRTTTLAILCRKSDNRTVATNLREEHLPDPAKFGLGVLRRIAVYSQRDSSRANYKHS